MRWRLSADMKPSVRMLCRRSASLTSSTRTSSAIASRSLRKFSPCAARFETRSRRLILVRPSTSAPICGPKLRLISSSVASVSSIVSCRTAAAMVASSSLRSVRIAATSSGWPKIGLARGALLHAMGRHGVDVGAVEEVLVGVGVVAAHPLDELVLPHHAAALGLGERALGRRRETADGRPCRCLGQRRLFQLNDWHISRILARAR